MGNPIFSSKPFGLDADIVYMSQNQIQMYVTINHTSVVSVNKNLGRLCASLMCEMCYTTGATSKSMCVCICVMHFPLP